MASKSLRKKMEARRKQLAEKGGTYNFFTFPEGNTRMRHVPIGEEQEFGQEVLVVWVSKEIGNIISPASFGEKCAINEAYLDLMKSKKDSDKEFAKKKLKPKKKFAVASYKYKDEKGKEVDTEKGVKLALCTQSQYNQMLDLWLDDDTGDFTDRSNGYDLLHKRTGSGPLDTEYNVLPRQKTSIDKKFKGPYDPEQMARDLLPTYKQTKEYLKLILNFDPKEEEANNKSKRSSSSKSSKNKKRKSDI